MSKLLENQNQQRIKDEPSRAHWTATFKDNTSQSKGFIPEMQCV